MEETRKEMDFPESYNSWLFVLHRLLGPKKKCWGFSPGGTIYYSHPEARIPDTLKAHERKHYVDAVGRVWRFRGDYLWQLIKGLFRYGSLTKAYKNISYEIDAREAAANWHEWVK